jgi:hypothetical protein
VVVTHRLGKFTRRPLLSTCEQSRWFQRWNSPVPHRVHGRVLCGRVGLNADSDQLQPS